MPRPCGLTAPVLRGVRPKRSGRVYLSVTSAPATIPGSAPPDAAAAAAPAGPAPACPRCGYDLAGTLALWRDSCPLDGACPECGLAFRWSDVLVPLRLMPRWLLEHPYRSARQTFLP